MLLLQNYNLKTILVSYDKSNLNIYHILLNLLNLLLKSNKMFHKVLHFIFFSFTHLINSMMQDPLFIISGQMYDPY